MFLQVFQNFPLFRSDRGRPSNISIFNNGSDIAFVNRQELIIESKPLEQPENVQFWLAFPAISLIFLIPLQVILSHGGHIPRILASVTKLRGIPAMLNSAWGGVLILKHTLRAWHLEGFRLSLLLLLHSLNSSRSTCIPLSWGNKRFSASAKSSTYFQHFILSPRFWAASLMTTWKPIGPSLVPWERAPLRTLYFEIAWL